MSDTADSPMYDPEKIYKAFPDHKNLFKAFYEGSKQGKIVKGVVKEFVNEYGTITYDFDFSDGTNDIKENFKICIDTFLESMQNRS